MLPEAITVEFTPEEFLLICDILSRITGSTQHKTHKLYDDLNQIYLEVYHYRHSSKITNSNFHYDHKIINPSFY